MFELLLSKGAFRVERICDSKEVIDNVLHHWYHNITYETLTMEEIKNSVENADILNMLNAVCNTNEEVSDLDLDL